jgi:uncharacterized protein (TIGR03118 family)
MLLKHVVPVATKLALVLGIAPGLCFADYMQFNLVSDVPGLANTTDPNLKNPWGVSSSATSPFWISNQGSGTSTLYNGVGTPSALVVKVPGGGPPSGPTGQVFNGQTAFALPNGTPAMFIFDTLNGTIVGWNGGAGTTGIQVASTPGAIYTGLASATVNGANYLYAADSTGQIRVFDSTFKPATLSGNFTDPNPMSGFTPFNIQLLNGNLYVTYAQLTPQGTGLPGGYIDEFDTSGNFIKRVATGGPLDAPWGLTIAPAGFGALGNDLLVGNFGNGEILAYDPVSGAYVSTLDAMNGNPIVNDFLWALDFRSTGPDVDPNALYLTAGINNQADGLFAEIVDVPEPASATFLFLGLAISSGAVYLRRRAIRATVRG